MRSMSLKCGSCGEELSPKFVFCPTCGRSVQSAVPDARVGTDSLERLVNDLATEAEKLGKAAGRFSTKALDHADAALKDPSAAARRALDRARKELETAQRDLDEFLRKI
jgi:hypothetical protein